MTWGEFKKCVEEQGLHDDDLIARVEWYDNGRDKPIVGTRGNNDPSYAKIIE